MSHTPSLFDDDTPAVVAVPPAGTIQEHFEAFHTANPWVLQALEKLVRQYVAKGRKRLGIRTLWETLRWNYAMSTTDPNSDFKLNDHLHSRYVRLLIERHPEWRDLFELRKLRAS